MEIVAKEVKTRIILTKSFISVYYTYFKRGFCRKPVSIKGCFPLAAAQEMREYRMIIPAT